MTLRGIALPGAALRLHILGSTENVTLVQRSPDLVREFTL
jgi:hypothetical protein